MGGAATSLRVTALATSRSSGRVRRTTGDRSRCVPIARSSLTHLYEAAVPSLSLEAEASKEQSWYEQDTEKDAVGGVPAGGTEVPAATGFVTVPAGWTNRSWPSRRCGAWIQLGARAFRIRCPAPLPLAEDALRSVRTALYLILGKHSLLVHPKRQLERVPRLIPGAFRAGGVRTVAEEGPVHRRAARKTVTAAGRLYVGGPRGVGRVFQWAWGSSSTSW